MIFLHQHLIVLYFNPIIVLFLTDLSSLLEKDQLLFQSYYSLIFNVNNSGVDAKTLEFQSYYSLIFNLNMNLESSIYLYHFNPIIVLFLTGHIFSQKGQKQFIIYLFMHLNLLIIKNVFYLYVSTKKTK